MVLRFLTENLGWKALSLAISLVLWWALVGEPELTTSISVPVQYLNMPKDFEISSEVLERVHLEIRGPSGKLSAEALQEAAVILNLRSVSQPAERTFPVEPADAYLPLGVQLIRAVPSQIRLQFERRLARRVPVAIRIGAGPPDGYEVAAQSAEPDHLSIVGPESRVRGVESVETDPVDLSALMGQAEYDLEVSIPDAYVRLDSPRRVRVSIAVRKK
jgi:YbbR domain-containing protein